MGTLFKYIGSKVLMKIVLVGLEVLVERTDNTWDNDALEKAKKYKLLPTE